MFLVLVIRGGLLQTEVVDQEFIHIHGTNDHTLPFKHIKPNYIIKGGSHMMTLTRGEEMSALLNRLCAL